MSEELPISPPQPDDGFEPLRDIVNTEAYEEVLSAVTDVYQDFITDPIMSAHINAIITGMTNLKRSI